MNEPVNSIEDVFYWVSKETGYSVEVIKNVYNNLFESIRHYLTRPHICGTGIKLNKFIKFEIGEKGLFRYVDLLKNNKIKQRNDLKTDLEYNEKMLKIIKKLKKNE